MIERRVGGEFRARFPSPGGPGSRRLSYCVPTMYVVHDMTLPVKHLSFSALARRWAHELARDPTEVAESLAQSIESHELKAEFYDPSYPAIDHYGVGADDDPRLEGFMIDVMDHIARVAKGIEAPDFDERLRYVSLAREDLETWLRAESLPVPQFLQRATSQEVVKAPPRRDAPSDVDHNSKSYRNLQKAFAVLILAYARTKPKYGGRARDLDLALSAPHFKGVAKA